MKLLRYGTEGQEQPGLLDDAGQIRDLSAHLDDLSPDTVTPDALARLREIDPLTLPLVDASVRVGACLSRVPNFYGIGLNYARHAAETGAQPPSEPIVFCKATTALAGPDDDLVLPPGADKTDWEVELGVVIGRVADRVSETDALSCVAGYCTINDLSERAWQMERGGTWMKGKSAPGFGPIGPWFVTPDEVPDPQALALTTTLNGETVQQSSTADMIFSVAQIISSLSGYMRLVPGDVIATGTPEGVGLGMRPQRYLRGGDVIEVAVAGLGRQRRRIVSA